VNRSDRTLFGVLALVLLMVAFVVFGVLHFAGVTR
jgi:hypothetical protein